MVIAFLILVVFQIIYCSLLNMNRISCKRISTTMDDEEDGCSSSKRTFRLSTKLKSIVDHSHDSWTTQKAYRRLTGELYILRSLITMLLALFKDDVKKLYTNPFDCSSKCNLRVVTLFTSMIKRFFQDKQFIQGT